MLKLYITDILDISVTTDLRSCYSNIFQEIQYLFLTFTSISNTILNEEAPQRKWRINTRKEIIFSYAHFLKNVLSKMIIFWSEIIVTLTLI